MVVYYKGVILEVCAPQAFGGNGTMIQKVVMQHAFNAEPKYNKYITFDVIGDKIDKLAFIPQEEVEVAIDIEARRGKDYKWFNNIRAFSVERDKSKWHRYEGTKRVAVMPANQNGQPQTPAQEEEIFNGDPYAEQ